MAHENLKQRFSMLEFIYATNLFESNNNRKISRIKEKQDRKLFRLGLKYKYKSPEPISPIFNFSNKVLTPFQKEVLNNGLKFCFNPGKIKYVNYFSSFDKLYQQLSVNKLREIIPDAQDYIRSNNE